LAIGYADGASQIQANNAGGIAGGFMAGGDSIAGRGCFAHGSSFVGTVQATDDGAFAHGAVYNGALIEATFAGAVALGTSTGTGVYNPKVTDLWRLVTWMVQDIKCTR